MTRSAPRYMGNLDRGTAETAEARTRSAEHREMERRGWEMSMDTYSGLEARFRNVGVHTDDLAWLARHIVNDLEASIEKLRYPPKATVKGLARMLVALDNASNKLEGPVDACLTLVRRENDEEGSPRALPVSVSIIALELARSKRLDGAAIELLLQVVGDAPDVLIGLADNPALDGATVLRTLQEWKWGMDRTEANAIGDVLSRRGREEVLRGMADAQQDQVRHAAFRYMSPGTFRAWVIERGTRSPMGGFAVRAKHGATIDVPRRYIEKVAGVLVKGEWTTLEGLLSIVTLPDRELLEILLSCSYREVRMEAIQTLRAIEDRTKRDPSPEGQQSVRRCSRPESYGRR